MIELYNKYVAHQQKMADINYSSAVLQWDQEVYMPQKDHITGHNNWQH